MQSLWQDIRFGLRLLYKKPTFSVIAVVTLALGIGVNAAIFSVVNAVLLRPLPYKEPERIITLWENNIKDGIERDDVSPANFLDWREHASTLEGIAFANPWSVDYTNGGEPETMQAARVSEDFFRILGVTALYGRTFLPEEYKEGNGQVVILSYGSWQSRFGGNQQIIGQTLTLDDQPTTVVGILPPEFELNLFDKKKEAWMPQIPDESMRRQRRATYLKVIARLKPDVTVSQARAEMDSIALHLAAEYPQTNSGIGITTVPLSEHLVGKVRPALWMMFIAVGFVLLIACANVANLLLARNGEREREFAIRAALGASRKSLIRQLLTESFLLALLGSAGGLLLAWWGIDLLLSFSPGDIPRLAEIGLNRVVLGFVVAIALLTTLLFGLVPALQFSRPNLNLTLKEAGQTSTGGLTRHRLRNALIISEIALAFVLLIGAGLLIRSFIGLVNVSPGFAAGKTIALQVFIWDRYATPEKRAAYVDEALKKIKEVPGVESAGVTTALPFFESGIDTSLPLSIDGQPTPPGQEPTAFYTIASADYFSSIGVKLLQGRGFNQFDTATSLPVVLVNETMAQRFWQSETPVGKKFTVSSTGRGSRGPTTFEIVGMVSDVRHDGLDKAPRTEFFRPYSQSPSGAIIFTVRTTAEPTAITSILKSRLWEINPTQPFYAISTMDALISDSLKARRFSLLLLGVFAVLALTLTVIGIYGVMSYSVTQRTREVGLRMALGARSSDVLKMVLRQGLILSLAGIGIGIVGAFLLTRLLSTLLFGITPTDPATYFSVSALLLGVALVACFVPARRAAKTDPMVALRYE